MENRRIIGLFFTIIAYNYSVFAYTDPETNVVYQGGYVKSSPYAKGDITILSEYKEGNSTYKVRYIDSEAFLSCREISSVVIPEGIQRVGGRAFKGCFGLKKIKIPTTLNYFGVDAFQATGLEEVQITNLASWCSIKFELSSGLDYLFSNPLNNGACLILNGNKIVDLKLPYDIESISNGAFNGCGGIRSVAFSENFSNLGSSVFRGCKELSSITFNKNITTIGSESFKNCVNIETVNIPDNVTSIYSSAFNGCIKLSTVYIGKNVNEISQSAFASCTNLKNVYCYRESSITNAYQNAFKNSNVEVATLHVPQELIDIYSSTIPWSDFGKIKSLNETTGLSELYTIPFLIKHNNEQIIINGATVGELIQIYDLAGVLLFSSKISGENTAIDIPQNTHNIIIIVKVGTHSVKMLMK